MAGKPRAAVVLGLALALAVLLPAQRAQAASVFGAVGNIAAAVVSLPLGILDGTLRGPFLLGTVGGALRGAFNTVGFAVRGVLELVGVAIPLAAKLAPLIPFL